jgi:DNA-binding NtrC family response regulator
MRNDNSRQMSAGEASVRPSSSLSGTVSETRVAALTDRHAKENPSHNPDAEELFLKAREFARVRNHAKAHELLDEASNTIWGSTHPYSRRIQIERSLTFLSEGDAAKALGIAQQLVSELRSSPQSRELGLALLALASAQRSLSLLGDSIRTLAAAQHVFEWELHDNEQTIRVLGLTAIVQKRLGKYALAQEALIRAIELSQEAGDGGREAQNVTNLAVLRIRSGNIADAEQMLESVLSGPWAAANARTRTWATLGLAVVRLAQSRARDARRLLHSLLRGTDRSAAGRDEILCLEYLADAATQEGRFARAAFLLAKALRIARSDFSGSDLICELQRRRAVVLAKRGEIEAAGVAAEEAIEIGTSIGEPFELALALRSRAIALVAQNNFDPAIQDLLQCVRDLRSLGEKYELSRTLVMLAGCYRDAGKPDLGTGHLDEARINFQLLNVPSDIDENDEYGSESARPTVLPRQDLEVPSSDRGQASKFGIISLDPRIHRAFASLIRVAPTKLPVLIEGESGTGKELFARALHGLSRRKDEAFIPLNCGAIPRDMQEAEFFGHARGSFTGALSDRIGYFESANGGTLFLDEIGEMTSAAQTRLLRVLESDEFCRVGETRTRMLDVRYVAATNRVLDEAVSRGDFRLDLFQRLNGLRIRIPSLSERPEDVPLLFTHFLGQFCNSDGPPPRIPRSLMELLSGYHWPGNVRELRRAVERAVILAGDSAWFADEHFPFLVGPQSLGNDASLPQELADIEKRRLIEALEESRWSKSDAARRLGMSRTTLNSKLQRYGVPLEVPERFRPPKR